MKINVPLKNGFLPDKYTKHASNTDKIGNNPIVSFPVKIKDISKNTKSLALVLTDDDAIPVCGFSYIHWVIANISPTTKYIPENASQTNEINATLGKNSLAGKLINNQDPKQNERYTGPTPPDKPHNYHLSVYALDEKLDLENGFWLNQLKQKMKNHIIASASQSLPVKN